MLMWLEHLETEMKHVMFIEILFKFLTEKNYNNISQKSRALLHTRSMGRIAHDERNESESLCPPITKLYWYQYKRADFLPESLIKAIKLFTIICIFIGHLKLDKIPDDNIQRKAELYYEPNHLNI